MQLAGPAALLATDSVEDELAVLESQTVRDHICSSMYLACKPVPDWEPNPITYQVLRVLSILFHTRAPLDYSQLAYPVVQSLEMDYSRLMHAKAVMEVDKTGNYKLTVNGAQSTAAPVGSELSIAGLTIAADGFTPGVAQRWQLKVSDPERVAIEMLDDLTVFRVGQRSQTIGVRYEDAHPELAARVVKALMDYYIQRDVDITQQVSTESLSYINEQISQIQAELEQQRQQMLTLLQDRQSLLASSVSPEVPSNYMKLDLQLSELQTERKQFDSLIDQLEDDKGFLGYYDPGVSSRRLETDLVDQIMNTERALQVELETKTEQHPRVVELRQLLDKLRGDMRKLLTESAGQIDREIANIRQERGQFETLLDLTPAASTELEKLKGEIEIRSQSLAALYGEKQRAALQQISSISSIKMLDPATPDRRHVRPRIFQSALTAVIFALFMTLAAILAYRAIDPAVTCARDLTSRFNLPVLAVLTASGNRNSEYELSRFRHELRKLRDAGNKRLGIVATSSGISIREAVEIAKKSMTTGDGTGAVTEVIGIEQSGHAAVYSETLHGIDALLLATTTGRSKLTELTPLISELSAAGRKLAGFVLLIGNSRDNGDTQA